MSRMFSLSVPLIVTGTAVIMYSTTQTVFANVSWIKMNNNRGQIVDYTVRFGLRRDMLLNKYVTSANHLSIIVPGLEADTAFYFCTANGRSIAGYGPLSNVVFSKRIALGRQFAEVLLSVIFGYPF